MQRSKLKFLLVVPPKTHVGDKEGRHQAGLIVGSTNNIQNTTSAEIGVEHQKTVKGSKIGKRNKGFSQVIKELFQHYLPEKEDKIRKDIEKNCIALIKLFRRY